MHLPRDLTHLTRRHWPIDHELKHAEDVPREQDCIAIVTAFFDINRGDWNSRTTEVAGKYRRSVDDYFSYFAHLAHLKNEMIIFVDPHLADRVLELRRAAGLADRTVILTIDGLLRSPDIAPVLDAIGRQMSDQFRSFVWRPTAPEYNKPDYVLVNALKTSFACTAVNLGLVRSPQLAWIDFGYARSQDLFDRDTEWRYDFGDKINLFAIFQPDDRPIYEIVRGGEVYFQGCHIVGPVGAWGRFNTQINAALQSLIDCNLIDDDQTLMLMAWRREPGSFIVRRRQIDPEYDWRFIFRRFQTGLFPENQDLPFVRQRHQPSWWRDLKNAIRRRMRKWRRSAG